MRLYPFGLTSALLIFSAIADVLQWIMEKMGIEWVVHYIDEFITMGAPGSNECEMYAAMMHAACERLGLPVEPEKGEGPVTRLPFLGIEYTRRMHAVHCYIVEAEMSALIIGCGRGDSEFSRPHKSKKKHSKAAAKSIWPSNLLNPLDHTSLSLAK